MSKPDGGPAFPTDAILGEPNHGYVQPIHGITMRDYFAAARSKRSGRLTVQACYKWADKMLQERVKS